MHFKSNKICIINKTYIEKLFLEKCQSQIHRWVNTQTCIPHTHMLYKIDMIIKFWIYTHFPPIIKLCYEKKKQDSELEKLVWLVFNPLFFFSSFLKFMFFFFCFSFFFFLSLRRRNMDRFCFYPISSYTIPLTVQCTHRLLFIECKIIFYYHSMCENQNTHNKFFILFFFNLQKKKRWH